MTGLWFVPRLDYLQKKKGGFWVNNSHGEWPEPVVGTPLDRTDDREYGLPRGRLQLPR